MKYLLKDGDRVFTTGAYLVYDQKQNKFLFDGFEDETFFDGKPLEWGEEGEDAKPYIDK